MRAQQAAERKSAHQMVELSQGHFRTNVFAHGNQRNCKDGKSLKSIILRFCLFLVVLLIFIFVLCGVYVFVTVMKHSLHPQYVPSTRERTSLHQNLRRLRDGMFDGF
jgi:hypothetical protein